MLLSLKLPLLVRPFDAHSSDVSFCGERDDTQAGGSVLATPVEKHCHDALQNTTAQEGSGSGFGSE